MACSVIKGYSPMMPKGIGLEVTHNASRLKTVVNLIIATERLMVKNSKSVLSTDFSDEHLLHIMLESIIEVKNVCESTSASSNDFQCSNEYVCSVTDSQQRSLVQNGMELHAVMLQGGSETRKVYLNMSTYVNHSPNGEARPVALGIKGTDLYLSCCKKGNVPTLHLENVKDKSILSTISPGSNEERFLFYKQDTGVNISTLMSASFPDWYISTEESDHKPVELCLESAQRYRTFNIQSQS
ncbi:hypothetical protein Q5P01_015291 [Channa striata]|uniref:Interleukin-1 n=1 Tax=Channa striata TaxID=64152 RepID=A0AA88MI80_CHASR|nr:hypothetical protein Q5P01_015291 [Channa striata]